MPDITRSDLDWLIEAAAFAVNSSSRFHAEEDRFVRIRDALKSIGRVEIVPRSPAPPAHVRQRLSARAKWAAIARENAVGGQA